MARIVVVAEVLDPELRQGRVLREDERGWSITFDEGETRYLERRNAVVLDARLNDPAVWNAWRRAGMRPERLLEG